MPVVFRRGKAKLEVIPQQAGDFWLGSIGALEPAISTDSSSLVRKETERGVRILELRMIAAANYQASAKVSFESAIAHLRSEEYLLHYLQDEALVAEQKKIWLTTGEDVLDFHMRICTLVMKHRLLADFEVDAFADTTLILKSPYELSKGTYLRKANGLAVGVLEVVAEADRIIVDVPTGCSFAVGDRLFLCHANGDYDQGCEWDHADTMNLVQSDRDAIFQFYRGEAGLKTREEATEGKSISASIGEILSSATENISNPPPLTGDESNSNSTILAAVAS